MTILIYSFLLLLIGMSIYAQETLSAIASFNSWNVSVIGVQTDNYNLFTPDQRNIVLTLFPILTAIIKEVDTHHMSAIEKYHARELKRKDALFTLGVQLEKLLLEEDIAALGNETGDVRSKRSNKRKEIQALEKRIRDIQALPNSDIPMSNSFPVKYNEQTEYISISNVEDFQIIANTLKSQSLLYYRVYPLDTFMIIEILEYNAIRQETTRLLRTVVSPKNIGQIYKSLQLVLHSAILGFPAASLRISAETSNNTVLHDAKILLDGDIVGFGTVSLSVITEGTHAISVLYGAEQRNEIIVLKPRENAFRNFLFDIETDDVITIRSNPSDVKAYVNSEWVGNTPVVISRPYMMAQLELREPGYEVYKMSISSTTNVLYTAVLTPTNPIPLSDRVVRDRKEFYDAFSIFAFSLVLPIVFNGLYTNETNALAVGKNALSGTGRSQSELNQSIYFYSFLGATLLSSGLGVFAYNRLTKYLDTASEYHEK